MVFLFLILVNINSLGFTVSGKVTTTTYTPIQHAVIRFVLTRDTSVVISTVTDTLGNYSIMLTGVPGPSSIVKNFKLYQNYPNPFSNRTEIPFAIEENSSITINIYDILGRRVKNYHEDRLTVGAHSIEWDGRDMGGNKLAYGIYFYRITSNQGTQTRKMVYVNPGESGSFLSHTKFVSNSENANRNVLTDTYTVYIENSDSTTPKIEFAKYDNITINGDTTINFTVDALYKWEFLGLGAEWIDVIAVHPANSDIIYAGSSQDFSSGIVGKLFKTTNAGITWDTLLVGGSYSGVAIDPINPDVVYALPYGIVKSTDGGESWRPILNGIRIDAETRLSSFAIDPNNTNILYAGTGGFFGGFLYKSTNAGETWFIPPGDTISASITCIAIDPGNCSTIYVGTDWIGAVFKTTNAGDNWTLTGLGETSSIIDAIAVSPFDSNLIYAYVRFFGLFKSEDGGVTWEKTKLEGVGASSILFSKYDTFSVYISTSSGCVKTTKKDFSEWIFLNEGLEIFKYRQLNIIVSNKEENILLAGRAKGGGDVGGIIRRKIRK